MALRFNGNSAIGLNSWSAGVGRVVGTVSGFNAYTGARVLSARGGSRMACHLHYSTAVGLPLGSSHPTAWAMPSVAGAIASRNNVTGSGGLTVTAQSGRNMDATLTGSGGISSAALGLIVSIAATLSGSGGISSATAKALASLAATLTGSGGVTAVASGVANLAASLSGAGTMTLNNTALADLSATLVGYGELTPEGIRDTVWNALLANYQISGSAGKTLELAGSGGVDYQALGEAVWAILLADANNPGSMGEFVQNISGGGGGSGLTLAQFLALK